MENIKPLLYTDGSLTEALSVALNQPIHVDVLRESSRPCSLEEAACLNDSNLWQREVILRADKPIILARTRIGLSKLNGPLSALSELGNRPLGEWLFQHKNLKKLSFTVDEHKKQRDTVYQLDGTSIWVQEIFI
jgi:chorismate-pyruvate lyase